MRTFTKWKVIQNGLWYQGEEHNGKRDGRGVIVWPNLYIRIGYSVDDMFHGEYTYFGKTRGMRMGSYKMDKKHGLET